MISPRTIFNRKPLGKNVLEVKRASKVKYNHSQSTVETNEIDFWIVEAVLNQQLELYIKGCDAVLHNFTSQYNSHLFTGFTETPIKCAVFTCLSLKVSTNATIYSIFQDLQESYSNGVVLFTDTIAQYFDFNNKEHTYEIPFQVSLAWKIRNCLLVEREETKSVSDEMSPNSLFLMSDTLAEFTPIVFKDKFGNCGFINDARFRIVSVCEASFLLLAYDQVDESFSLWRIRDVVHRDIEDLYDEHWDGSIAVKKEKLQWNNSFVSSFRSRGEHSIGNHHNNSHVSSEYFEISTDETAINLQVRTVDDLDILTPIARSLKLTKDAQIPDEMTLLQEIDKINQINRQTGKPLYPKVCLDFLFQCKSSLDDLSDSNSHGNDSKPSVKGFFAEDFYRRKYLCCLKKDGEHNMLKIVKFNYENNCFSYVGEHCMAVLDAVYLDGLKLIIILEIGSTLAIYTGLTRVGEISLSNALIYEPNLFHSNGSEISMNDINNMVSLSEPTNNGFTIHTKSNLSVRLYLPEMVRSHLVKQCLLVLKKLLPIEVGMDLLCRWHCFNSAVDNDQAALTEWSRFDNFLRENMGFIKNQESGLYDDVAVRLLSRFATTVLFSLHLVYECEKINSSPCFNLDDLAALNCSLACSVKAEQFIDYYVRDNSDLWPRVDKLSSLIQYVSPEDNEMIWNPQPPNWNKLFTDILLNRPCDRYPIIEDLNEMILHLIKIWLVMFRHEELREDPQIELKKYLYRINFKLNGKPCQFPIHVCKDIIDSIGYNVLNIVDINERVATYLGQINFHTADLYNMNFGLTTIFKLVFFHCKKHYPHLYNILHRLDLDKQDQQIMPSIKEIIIIEVMPNPLHKFRSLSEARRNCFSYFKNNVKPSINIKNIIDLNKIISLDRELEHLMFKLHFENSTEISDYRFIVKFVEKTHNLEFKRIFIPIVIHSSVRNYVLQHITEMKEFLLKIKRTDLNDFTQFIMLMNWVDNNLDRTWSVFSTYYGLSLHSFKAIQCGEEVGDDDTRFLLKIISTDLNDFNQVIMLMNWCFDNNLMRIWSEYKLSYDFSKHLTEAIQSGQEVGD